MTIASTRVVPDLQYWFSLFVINSNLNKDVALFPVTLDDVYLTENKSFIRLLFDDNWLSTLTSYGYMFNEITNRLSIPSNFRTRLMIYPRTGKYYTCIDSETSINIFSLESDDLTLLDKLLEYRLDSTGTTIVDIDYSSLSTNLSKLIYLYLDFKINDNYTIIDSITPLSDSYNLLETCYEMYICETLFNYISNKGT